MFKVIALAAGTAISTMGLTVANTGVSIDPLTDLVAVENASSAYLTSAFEIVELLPYIAVIAWGFFLVNKLMGVIPSGWK